MNDDEIDRSLIDTARPGLDPAPEQRARLRRAVTAAIAAGTAGSATSAAAAVKGAGGVLAVWSTGKIVVAVVIAVAAVVAGTTWISESSTGEGSASWIEAVPAPTHDVAPPPALETARGSTTSPSPAVVAIAQRAGVATAPEASAVDGPHEVTATPPAPNATVAPASTRSRETGLSGRTRASEAPAAGESVASTAIEPTSPETPIAAALQEETALLRAAHRALEAHDHTAALHLLEVHASRYPEGILREERLATRILTLCDAGLHDRARTEAAGFLAAHPQSMHATRVRASCAGP